MQQQPFRKRTKTAPKLPQAEQSHRSDYYRCGTLPPRVSSLAKLPLDGGSELELLRLAASAESGSTHPLGKAVTAAAQDRKLSLGLPSQFQAVSGYGIRAQVQDQRVLIGNPRFMQNEGIDIQPCADCLQSLQAEGKTVMILASGQPAAVRGVLALSVAMPAATGAGALSFATAMISAIGNEGLKVAGATSDHGSEVGNIVFVCEYLMGMPSISAIVVYINAHDHVTQFQAGPCIKTESHSMTFKMHKDTYMFVTPTFIREYAGDLNTVTTDAAYGELVKSMREHLTREEKPAAKPADTPAEPKKK